MKLTQFNGGLNTALSPQLLQLNEAVEYTNIDSSKGNLSPLQDKKYTDRQLGRYIFNYKNNWTSTKIRHWYTEYNQYAYRVNGKGIMEYSDNGIIWRPVYLDDPTIEKLSIDPKDPKFITVASYPSGIVMQHSSFQLGDSGTYPMSGTKYSGKHHDKRAWQTITINYKIVLSPESDDYFFHADKQISGVDRWYLNAVFSPGWQDNQWVRYPAFNLARFNSGKDTFINANTNTMGFLTKTLSYNTDETCFGTGSEWDGEYRCTGVTIVPSVPGQIDSVSIVHCRLYRVINGQWYMVDYFKRSENARENAFVDWLPDDILVNLGNYIPASEVSIKRWRGLPPVGGNTKGTIFKEIKINYIARYIDDIKRTGNISNIESITHYQFASDASKVGNIINAKDNTKLERGNVIIKLKNDRPFDPLATPTKVEIYRQGGTLSNYTLVKSYPIADNDTYIDDVLDKDVDGAILPYVQKTAMQENARYLTENKGTLYSAVGTTLLFSNAGSAETWLEFNFIEFKDTITGIAKNQIGLIVFTKTNTYVVTGSSIDDYTKILLSSNYGCISHDSIAYNGDDIYFMSIEGLCVLSGSVMNNLSLSKIPDFTYDINTIPAKAIMVDGIYYLALGKEVLYDKNDKLVEVKPKPTKVLLTIPANYEVTVPNEIKIKLRDEATTGTPEVIIPKGFKITKDIVQINEVQDLVIKNGIDKIIHLPNYLLYYNEDGSILVSDWLIDYTTHIEADRILYCNMRFGQPIFGYIDEDLYDLHYVGSIIYMTDKTQKLAGLLENTTTRSIKWKSPHIAEGGLSIIKNTKVIYFYSEGDITIRVLLDGKVVMTKKLNEDGFTEVKLPQQQRLTYYVQLEVEGTGVLKEIEYIVESRQNGR